MNEAENVSKQIIQCPICHFRLCDAVVNSQITMITACKNDGVIMMKCHKCRRQVGILIKVKNKI